MKKEDLKTGMIIKKDTGYFMVFKDTQHRDFYVGKTGEWDNISNFCWGDVEAVYYLAYPYQTPDFFQQNIKEVSLKLLWQRKRTIQIDGKEIELSEESYQNIKKHFET